MKPIGTMPRALAVRVRSVRSLALIGLAALLPAGQALAAKPVTNGKFTCSIADPGPITAGTPVTFSGTLSGSKPPYNVTWTFPDATPPGTSPQVVNFPPGTTTKSKHSPRQR